MALQHMRQENADAILLQHTNETIVRNVTARGRRHCLAYYGPDGHIDSGCRAHFNF